MILMILIAPQAKGGNPLVRRMIFISGFIRTSYCPPPKNRKAYERTIINDWYANRIGIPNGRFSF